MAAISGYTNNFSNYQPQTTEYVQTQVIQTQAQLSTLPNLESSLGEQITKIDLNAECDFELFLSPNEACPEGIKDHLNNARPGIIVSTGTERNFFNLLHCNELCTGIVSVDINPKVKAYGDFNVLLLRIAKDCDDYETLSDNTYDLSKYAHRLSAEEFLQIKVDELKRRIETDTLLSEEMKGYYLDHLKDFGNVYYTSDFSWKTYLDDFANVRYFSNVDQFNRLQKFAREGNIVFTVGDMNDLSFLNSYLIAAVDTSNISDYVMLSLKVPNDTPIIYTRPNWQKTTYSCYVHKNLTLEENCEFDKLLKTISTAHRKLIQTIRVLPWVKEKVSKFVRIAFDHRFRSNELLLKMRDYFENHVLEFPDGTVLALPDTTCKAFTTCKALLSPFNYDLFTLPAGKIAELCQNPKVQRHLKEIVASWAEADLKGYLSFSQMEGWKEEFMKNFKNHISDFPNFLKRVEEQNQLNTLRELLTSTEWNELEQTIA